MFAWLVWTGTFNWLELTFTTCFSYGKLYCTLTWAMYNLGILQLKFALLFFWEEITDKHINCTWHACNHRRQQQQGLTKCHNKLCPSLACHNNNRFNQSAIKVIESSGGLQEKRQDIVQVLVYWQKQSRRIFGCVASTKDVIEKGVHFDDDDSCDLRCCFLLFRLRAKSFFCVTKNSHANLHCHSQVYSQFALPNCFHFSFLLYFLLPNI